VPATCYRCIDRQLTPVGEPFGACERCSSLACLNCGVRVPVINLFRCVSCFSGLNLLTPAVGHRTPPGSGGGGRPGGGPGGLPGGGPGGLPGGDDDTTVVAYRDRYDFEAFSPRMAELTGGYRRHYSDNLAGYLVLADGYVRDKALRDSIAAAQPYLLDNFHLRDDLLAGADRLAGDVQGARDEGTLREDLLADAFGVAQYTVGAEPGERLDPAQLVLISDQRLRFLVVASSAVAEAA
jgi:hypothetical protein